MTEKKYIVIENMVKEGKYTKAQLMEAIGTEKEKTFEAQLRFMRIRDKYVLPNADGIYYYCTEEQWEDHNAKIKAANKKKAKPKKTFLKDPSKKLAALYSQYDKKMAAVQKAQQSFDKDDQLTSLLLQEKQIQFSIVKLKINQLRAKMANEIGVTPLTIDAYFDSGTLDEKYQDAREAFKKAQEQAGDKPPEEAGVDSDDGLAAAANA
jgi:hypothetical protein